ncbi:MAG: metalloregulator ArsR/SmtB family transcription factor [Steroidobacteraceae bacterium]
MSSSAAPRGLRKEERLDALFHALSHRARRALLSRLAQAPAMITELAQPFGMSLPAISRHIRVLEQAGLVVRSVEGRVHQCSLDALPLKTADQWLSRYRSFWEQSLESLARYAERH